MISSFGVDAAGELYVVNYGDGTIVALRPGETTPAPARAHRYARCGHGRAAAVRARRAGRSTPPPRTRGSRRFMSGAFPLAGGAPQFIGVANQGDNRPDVAAIFGPQFGSTGFHLSIKGLSVGRG